MLLLLACRSWSPVPITHVMSGWSCVTHGGRRQTQFATSDYRVVNASNSFTNSHLQLLPRVSLPPHGASITPSRVHSTLKHSDSTIRKYFSPHTCVITDRIRAWISDLFSHFVGVFLVMFLLSLFVYLSICFSPDCPLDFNRTAFTDSVPLCVTF